MLSSGRPASSGARPLSGSAKNADRRATRIPSAASDPTASLNPRSASVAPWRSRCAIPPVLELAGHDRFAAQPTGRAARCASRRQLQCFGEIFPAKVWLTIFPSFTTNVSVPSS